MTGCFSAGLSLLLIIHSNSTVNVMFGICEPKHFEHAEAKKAENSLDSSLGVQVQWKIAMQKRFGSAHCPQTPSEQSGTVW